MKSVALLLAAAFVTVVGSHAQRQLVRSPSTGTQPLTAIQLGPPITRARLRAWHVPSTEFRFRQTYPSGRIINALQAIAKADARTGSLSGGYVAAARTGFITTPNWATGGNPVLNHRLVWLVVDAHAPVPGTVCGGVGRLFVPVDARTGETWTVFAVARCDR